MKRYRILVANQFEIYFLYSFERELENPLGTNFLELIFDYKNVQKSFNYEEGVLHFLHSYKVKYLKLKNEILKNVNNIS